MLSQRVGAPETKHKTEQVLAIQLVYDGKDVFVWLPPGFGKSFCYEALPFFADWKRGRVDSKPTSTSDTRELLREAMAISTAKRRVDKNVTINNSTNGNT